MSTTNILKGDLWLFDTEDGGEIVNDNGTPTMTYGPESMAYLALFGHVGGADTWWGNDNLDKNEQLQGKLVQYMNDNPLTANVVTQAEEYALQDLQAFIDTGFCSDIEVAIAIEGPKRVGVYVILLQSDKVIADFKFTENWLYIQNNNPATRAR